MGWQHKHNIGISGIYIHLTNNDSSIYSSTTRMLGTHVGDACWGYSTIRHWQDTTSKEDPLPYPIIEYIRAKNTKAPSMDEPTCVVPAGTLTEKKASVEVWKPRMYTARNKNLHRRQQQQQQPRRTTNIERQKASSIHLLHTHGYPMKRAVPTRRPNKI